jgi:restriction endonuclease Mrr
MFEMLIGDLLRAYGFKLVEPASISGEGGFDFVAQSSMKDPFGRSEVVDWIVEARATRGPTSVHSLRAFLGVLSQRRERGLFVTSGQLTSLARDWLQQVARDGGPQISLIEGPEIKRLIVAKPNLLTKYFGGHGEA